MIETPSNPDQPDQRIALLDELRGLAVFGMLLINILGFGLSYFALVEPSLAGSFTGVDRALFTFSSLFAEGSFRAIFCVLFGFGVLFQFERSSERTGLVAARLLHKRRMRWLILFGIMDTYLLLWFGDILLLYGLLGLCLLAFRRLSAAKLMSIAAALLLLLSLQNFYFGGYFADPIAQFAQFEPASPESARTQLLEQVEAERAAVSAGYTSAWPLRAFYSLNMLASSLVRGGWEASALMLIGMALYKWRVHQLRLAPRTYAIIAIAGIAAGLGVNYGELRQAIDAEMLGLTQFLWSYDLGRIALATGYASLLALLCKLHLAASIRKPLAASGQMALSNYLLHSIVCLVFFVGFGYFGELRYHQLYLVVAVIWVFQIWFSSAWLKRFRFGPMEWVWRSLVNRERQPIRR